MEIYSVRSSQNFLYKNNSKNPKTPEIEIEKSIQNTVSFQVSDAKDDVDINFSAISPRELREIARANFDSGKIDLDTFATLSDGLPMHAIDARGNVIDLSSVTDSTSFDFQQYYENQLQIAISLGDAKAADVLKSVMTFLNDPLP